jgi:MoxR-like ATPase
MSEEKQKRVCKGTCKQYKAKRPKDGNRYANGQVRCLICGIYMGRDGCKDKDGNQATEDTEGLRCKCCNYRVRSKPRNKVYKEKLREQMGINDVVEDISSMDIEELKNFITTSSKPQANYQYVVIKTLLENNFLVSKDVIVNGLVFYNKDKPPQDYNQSMVFGVLEERNIIMKTDDGNYSLNIESDVESFDVLETISLCNQRIYVNKIKRDVDYFIALGPWENWNHTIDNLPLRWGIADTTPSNTAVYDLASEGDAVFFYPTKEEPTYFSDTGFFGVGIIRKKEINKEEQYWPLEKKTGRAFFTHKIFIDVIKFAQSDAEMVPVITGLPLVKGFNHVREGEALNELLENSKVRWNVSFDSQDDTPENIWKIAPGTQASEWESQKESGIIGIGWNELGDLTGKSIEEVHPKIRELWPASIGNVSPQFRSFLSIKKGDIILANKGMSKVMGIGRVTGDYVYSPNSIHAHTYPVDWFDTEEKDILQQRNWFVTVTSVSKDIYESILSDSWPQQFLIPENLEYLIQRFDQNHQLFNPDWEGTESAQKDTEKFKSLFPKHKIQNLTLDEYVSGKPDPQTGEVNKTTFCNVLEGQLNSHGSLWGSYATKFGIFYSPKRNDYYYDSKKFSSSSEVFEKIKEDILYLIEVIEKFNQDKDWIEFSKAVDDRPFAIMRNVISKLISVYLHDDWVSIHTVKAIDALLDYFKIPRGSIQDKRILKKSKLIEVKNSHPIMKNWSGVDYSHFLWNAIVGKTETDEIDNPDSSEISPVETSASKPNFVLIRHNPSFKRRGDKKNYDNKLGREYNYTSSVVNYDKINSDTRAVWFYTDKDNLYFWGIGFVENVTTDEENKFTAIMRNFHYFDEQFNPDLSDEPSAIKSPTILQQQIKKLTTWNPFNSIVQIDETIFDQILTSEHLDNTFEDKSLPFPTPEALDLARETIRKDILVKDDVINQIFSTLLSGKNILLVGPVGSGKTHLSTILPKIGWKEFGGYYSQVYTATADWTTQDVIGGIFPKLDQNDQVMYNIQKGCVAETVAQNWLNENSDSGKRVLYEKVVDGKVTKYRGVWLVIDEFNRANIDRSFGQLFTALEYNKLQIPTVDPDKAYENLQIPKDYRIIGTLNTSDKHFLHTLSDALKRRFAIIQIPLPEYSERNTELFYVVQKSQDLLENLPTIKFELADYKIQSCNDPEVIKILNVLHALMTYTREIKPLGTALLISMFRFMITNYTITNDWQKSLDLALTSTILPQLETLPYWTLKVIRAVFCNTPGFFFKSDSEIIRDGIENYRNDFSNLVNFLKKVKPPSNKIIKRFGTSSLTDEDFESLNPWSDDLPKPNLSNFRDAITRIIEEKGFSEESEVEDE